MATDWQWCYDNPQEAAEEIDKLQNIIKHLHPAETGTYFICGGSIVEDDGLPKTIMVCPSFCLDGFGVYTKVKDYDSPKF